LHVSARKPTIVHAAAGELGWEIYVRMEDMARLYDTLLDNGSDLQLEHFGSRVINTLRIEKGEHLGKNFVRFKGGKSIPGIEWEPSMESITNVYPLQYCKLSNVIEELGYKLHLENTAWVLFAP
jgi:hypothetical protein